jgi:hypothetical protein
VVREPYEELLWWLMMPSLLRIAGEAVVDRAALAEMEKKIAEALDSAETAGYRIDALLGSSEAEEVEDKVEEEKDGAEGGAVAGEVSADVPGGVDEVGEADAKEGGKSPNLP